MTIDWIDVKKSLPNYDEQVLLCVEGNYSQTPPLRGIALGMRIATTRLGEKFNVTGHVTHWALEPKLPMD